METLLTVTNKQHRQSTILPVITHCRHQ